MEEAKDGFVLDCSVTMAWCFDDEATPHTDGIRDSLAIVGAVVPSIWPLEVANATIVGERRKRLDEARSRRCRSSCSGRCRSSSMRKPQQQSLCRHRSPHQDLPAFRL